MSQALQQKIFAFALEDIPYGGFSDGVLARAAAKAGVPLEEAKRLFPHGPASLTEHFSHWADAEMAARAKGTNIKSVREKIANTVRSRIEILQPYKPAARKAAAFLAMPRHAALAAKLTAQTSDAVWRAIGDRSTDFNYYSKRVILMGVYSSTLLYWLSDSSEENNKTWNFLDARIANVMQFEKFKANVKAKGVYVPDPFKVLGAFRTLSRR